MIDFKLHWKLNKIDISKIDMVLWKNYYLFFGFLGLGMHFLVPKEDFDNLNTPI